MTSLPSMTFSFLRLWLEPDPTSECQDPHVHPSSLWQFSQSHKQKSTKAVAVGEGASSPNTREHYSLRHSHSWPFCFHRCQPQYFTTWNIKALSKWEHTLFATLLTFQATNLVPCSHKPWMIWCINEGGVNAHRSCLVFLSCGYATMCQFTALH